MRVVFFGLKTFCQSKEEVVLVFDFRKIIKNCNEEERRIGPTGTGVSQTDLQISEKRMKKKR